MANRLRINIVIMLLVIFPNIVSNLFPEGKYEVEWDKIKIAWQEFTEYPSDENLKKVYRYLPSFHVGKLSDSEQRKIFPSGNVTALIMKSIEVLEKEIYSGNIEAVRVGFKLLHVIINGWNYRDLLKILGNLVRINPEIFLQELKNHHKTIDGKEFNMVLSYLDTVYYTDKTRARLRETELRIKALESVNIESLNDIKSECLKILREDKKMYKEAVESENKRVKRKKLSEPRHK